MQMTCKSSIKDRITHTARHWNASLTHSDILDARHWNASLTHFDILDHIDGHRTHCMSWIYQQSAAYTLEQLAACPR